MSQAGEIDVIGSNPQIPVLFVADVGSAVPILNTLEILGTSVVAGTTPVETTASGNTLVVEVQTAQAIAATNATNIGLAAFDSASFTVDANGFVSLIGGGSAIDSFTTDLNGPVIPDGAGNVAFTGATNIFSNGSVANTMRLNLQGTDHALFVGRGSNTASASIPVGTNGQALLGSTGADPAFATIATNANMNTVTGAASLTLNPYNCAKWIVDPTANIGTHQTITAALTSASSGDTIFIRPGTYTENLTGKAGVNLTAFSCDAMTPNVTIIGTFTFTSAGTVSISGINLQTNSAALLAVTGSEASIVNLTDCNLNMTNSTGITFSSSNASAKINIYDCTGNLGTTGIAYWAHSSAGTLSLFYSTLTNTGLSTTASTMSSGTTDFYTCNFAAPFTASGTATFTSRGNRYTTSATNSTCFTMGGSSSQNSEFDKFLSGTASAISVSTTVTLSHALISSSNTNTLTGAGTLRYAFISFISSSSGHNVTTMTALSTLI